MFVVLYYSLLVIALIAQCSWPWYCLEWWLLAYKCPPHPPPPIPLAPGSVIAHPPISVRPMSVMVLIYHIGQWQVAFLASGPLSFWQSMVADCRADASQISGGLLVIGLKFDSELPSS